MPVSKTIHRAHRYRLWPKAEQEQKFGEWAGVVRLVYNLALEQRRDHWRAYKRCTGHHISYPSQGRELTKLRAEFDFIREVPQTCQACALRDLDRAFTSYFAGRAQYPRPRKKGTHEGFTFRGREVAVERLNRNWGRIRLPKLGWVRFRLTREVRGNIREVSVTRDSIGWHVSMACEILQIETPNQNPPIGVDRGVSHALAMSDGTFADMPIDSLRLLDRRIRKQKGALARCLRGSNRRAKTLKRIAANNAKAARIRKHFNHVQSQRIAKAFGAVVVEDLNTADMTRSAKGTVEQPGSNVAAKAGLNRVILEQGWHQFEIFLAYKLEASGGQLIKVPAAYTSQTCSSCGSISKHHRKSQAVFQCSDCGHSANADTNAAINILRAGTRPADANDEVAHVVRESREAA